MPSDSKQQQQQGRAEANATPTDENEFVMIDHPAAGVPEVHADEPETSPNVESNDHATTSTAFAVDAPMDGLEATQFREKGAPETDANKPVIAEIAHQPVKEDSTPFDAAFGVNQGQQQQQQQHEEDEPVMVSSLSGSELSDPFTASTNSSSHRVAPPPPPPPSQARRSASTTATPTPSSSTRHTKKPPAPPPPHRAQAAAAAAAAAEPHDFDAIFGTPVPPAATATAAAPSSVRDEFESDDNDEFDTYFSDPKFTNNSDNKHGETPNQESEFDSVFAVTPTSGIHAAFSGTSMNHAAVSNENSNNVNKEQGSTSPFDPPETQNDAFAATQPQHGFQDAFGQPSPAIAAAASVAPETAAANDSVFKGENQGVESINDTRGVKEEQKQPQGQRVKEQQEQANTTTTTTSEPATASTSSTSAPDDGKKKKKKKNIVSWAKSFGGFDFSGLDNQDKKKKKAEKKSLKKEQQQSKNHASSSSNTPSVASVPAETQNSSGFDDSIQQAPSQTTTNPTATTTTTTTTNTNNNTNNNNNFAYDLDTIQGSHIAELVNMGFEPAAALEALDRYDQDLEKATNFLLDQAYN